MSKDLYHANLAIELLDWNVLSNNGTLFDDAILHRAFELEKPILLFRHNMLLIHLKLRPLFWGENEGSGGVLQYLAYQMQLMTKALVIDSNKVMATEMRHFSHNLRVEDAFLSMHTSKIVK